LIAPTLHNLFTVRHVKLVFCATVQALLAYLTAHGQPAIKHVDTEPRERLILVNPLALHASTSSFSAQGLSRTFASAAETASKTGAVLYMVECQGKQRDMAEHNEQDNNEQDNNEQDNNEQDNNEQDNNEQDNNEQDTEMVDEHEQTRAHVEEGDPWDQEVSILNVSARRFGSGSSDRAWAGRTVKARSIAARWFQFRKPDDCQTRKDPG